jgi:anti-anti-sigma factor
MEITEERRVDVLILGILGRLDSTTSKSVEEKLVSAIEAGERRLVIDLSELEYISSAGLRVFLLAVKRMTAVSGKVALSSLKDPIKQVFDIAGFSSMLSIYGSPEEAVKGV